jgi:alginate O-acetyltransferase complex protein AlgJ
MPRSTATRLAFAVLAVGFFATPVAARVVGITAEAFENRRFAEAPELSQGWDAFQQTGRFLVDRMPLRAQAVRANTRIWTDVFGAAPRYGTRDSLSDDGALPFAGAAEEPGGPPELTAEQNAAQVLPGADGWLFVAEEQRRSCDPALPFEEAVARWRELVTELRARGKRALLVVPPDKSTIYPEHVEPGAEADCAAAGKRRFWAALEAVEDPSVAPLRAELARRKRGAGDDLFARKDSHWTTLGSLVLVEAVLDRIGRGIQVRDAEVVDPGRVEYTGDLTLLLGASDVDTRVQRAVVRAPNARKVPGRTVVVSDSFFDAPQHQLAPYLEQMVLLSWPYTPLPKIAAEIRSADTVILETVERELTFRATDTAYVPPLLELLRAESAPSRAR